MTGVGRDGDSSFGNIYKDYFAALSASDVKDMINVDNHTEFYEAALEAIDEIVSDFRKNHDSNSKNQFIELAAKFARLFPNEKKDIDDLNKVAQGVLGIKQPIQELNSSTPSLEQEYQQEEPNFYFLEDDVEVEEMKDAAESDSVDFDELETFTDEQVLVMLEHNPKGTALIYKNSDLPDEKILMIAVKVKAGSGPETIEAWEFHPGIEEGTFKDEGDEYTISELCEKYKSKVLLQSEFNELSELLAKQMNEVPLSPKDALDTYKALQEVASEANFTIPKDLKNEFSSKITYPYLQKNGSQILQQLLEGKAAEMSFDEIQSLLNEIDNFSKTYPLPPQVGNAVLAKTVLEYADSHKDELKNQPEVSTRAHATLHDLAQKEIAEGNYQSAFSIEGKAAALFTLPTSHPLHEMDRAILEGSARQVNTKVGAFFGSLDTSIVKGGHLHATQRTIDGQLLNCFDFHISHYVRDELTVHLDAILDNPEEFIGTLPEGLCTEVKIKPLVTQQYVRYDDNLGEFTRTDGYNPCDSTATEINFEGAGKIIIGDTPENGTMYNWIQVEMDANLPPGEGAKKLQQILAVSGLGPVLGIQPPEADERMKIAQLFRAFYPSSCTAFDTLKGFYHLPIEELKKRMIMFESGMEDIFKLYLEDSPELMEKVTILPGKEVWGIKDLGQLMKANGAWGLMTGVGNSGSPNEAVARILTQGALSSEQRFQTGVFKEGASSEDDLMSGGGDQVFARLVNDNTGLDSVYKITVLRGKAQILWNLETVAQRVPYGFTSDMYGMKNRFAKEPDQAGRSYLDYQGRLNVLQLAATNDNPVNEFMLKNAVDPSHVAGILVQFDDAKDELIDHLVKNGLAEQDRSGDIYIVFAGRRIKADDFIHVGAKFKKEWWG